VELFMIWVTNTVRSQISPLARATYYGSNNLIGIPEEKRHKFQNGSTDSTNDTLSDVYLPGGPSCDFLAPFIALASVAFWIEPMLATMYVRCIPVTQDISVPCTLAFILTFVVPIPSLAKRKLGHYHNAQFFVLVITYMAMLLFAGFYSHFLIQAVVTLQQ
jgi:hypothetical protein